MTNEIKHKVNRLIKTGKFTQVKVKTKANLTLTYKELKARTPDAYFEQKDNYLLYYHNNKLTAYSLE